MDTRHKRRMLLFRLANGRQRLPDKSSCLCSWHFWLQRSLELLPALSRPSLHSTNYISQLNVLCKLSDTRCWCGSRLPSGLKDVCVQGLAVYLSREGELGAWLCTWVVEHQLLQGLKLSPGGDVVASAVQLADLVMLDVISFHVVPVPDGQGEGTWTTEDSVTYRTSTFITPWG